MKESFLKVYLFLFLAAFFSTPCLSRAEFWLPQSRPLERSVLSFEWENHVHYSDSNFDSSRYLKNLDANILFSKYKWGLSYSPLKKLMISPYFSSGSLFHNMLPVMPFQLLETGVNIKASIPLKVVTLSPELDLSYPLEFPQRNDLFLSDKAIKATPSLVLYLSFMNQFQPFFKIGYQYRDLGLSHLLLYQAGIMYQDRVWQIGVLAGGFLSPISDALNTDRHQLLNQYNLGSLKFYSENPGSHNISVWTNLRMSKKFQILLAYSTNFMGINYAHDHSFALNFQYRFIKKAKSFQKRKFEEKSDSIESILNDSFDSGLSQEIENF